MGLYWVRNSVWTIFQIGAVPWVSAQSRDVIRYSKAQIQRFKTSAAAMNSDHGTQRSPLLINLNRSLTMSWATESLIASPTSVSTSNLMKGFLLITINITVQYKTRNEKFGSVSPKHELFYRKQIIQKSAKSQLRRLVWSRCGFLQPHSRIQRISLWYVLKA